MSRNVAFANQFNLELRGEFESEVEGGLKKYTEKLAIFVLEGFIHKMPVDTGRAKANVNVTLGSRNYTWSEAYDKTGAATLSKGIGVIKSRTDPYQLIAIQDSVPYIEVLESGGSNQAPLGMAGVTVTEAEIVFR